jgi:hypothetical protein
MKAILEFNLPDDADDHKYALAGLDSLLVISDVLNEIRSFLKYETGYFKDFDVDQNTLERVREYIIMMKEAKKLPELN